METREGLPKNVVTTLNLAFMLEVDSKMGSMNTTYHI